ncbi:MAG TPA: D-aminoacyl-tRNA deacylase [Patescibacteria group bacterium]|nr:D-aminoacyl-tRNA deacylase [Patescibacteria group bacterium]
MRAVIQQVSQAQVKVSGEEFSRIDNGLLVFLAVKQDDEVEKCQKMAQKISKLRIFEDENDKMNLSVQDIKGEVLVVSQFTLYGDASSGNRPSFIHSAKPDKAQEFYLQVIKDLQDLGLEVKTGKFQKQMQVNLTNIGPKTIIIDL